MAIGAIGGLATEAIVALFFMPCLYALTARHGESMKFQFLA